MPRLAPLLTYTATGLLQFFMSNQSAQNILHPLQAAPTERFSQICKALADPLRRDVLQVLQQDAFGVLELCQILAIAQPALSHHLKILTGAGLLYRRRHGTSIFYGRASVDPSCPLATMTAALLQALDQLPVRAQLRIGMARIHETRSERSTPII